MKAPVPSFENEKLLNSQGYVLIAGIDEAGRAPLAGPVAAAAVILKIKRRNGWLREIRDSKLLSPIKREQLARHIRHEAVAFGIGFSSNLEIDNNGISRATRLAMLKAIDALTPRPHALLIDYFRLPESILPQKGILHGDAICMSIACASILAKVARDRLMDEMDELYPGYGFRRNKGYPTRLHLDRLRSLGPCPIHRNSFHPIKPRLDLCYEG
jgi:ribonuclease HII